MISFFLWMLEREREREREKEFNVIFIVYFFICALVFFFFLRMICALVEWGKGAMQILLHICQIHIQEKKILI